MTEMAVHSSIWVLAGVFLIVLAASDPVRIEADVGDDVLLPCIVERRDAVSLSSPMVNWQRSETEVVNSYYNGMNHPEYQSKRYKGRTEFSSQGLSDGNVSLLLKSVTPVDYGNYTCHANLYEDSPQTLQTVLLKQKKTPGENEKRLRILSICVPLSLLVILGVGSFVGYCWCKKKNTKPKEVDRWLKTGSLKCTKENYEGNTNVSDDYAKKCSDMATSDNCDDKISEPCEPSLSLLNVSAANKKACRYVEDDLKLGFSWTGNEAEPVLLCVICYKTLTNESTKPSNLKHHFDSKHKEYKGKPAEFFENRHKDLQKS